MLPADSPGNYLEKKGLNLANNKALSGQTNYCRVNQEWQWRSILFTIAK